jgi:hypothetical protein
MKVYKVGDEPERQVYVVGKTSDGQPSRRGPPLSPGGR